MQKGEAGDLEMKRQIPSSPLRREREFRGWSRGYVAEQLGVDIATVGRWEREECVPHPYHQQRLCELFEKNAQELGLLAEEPEANAQGPGLLAEELEAPGMVEAQEQEIVPEAVPLPLEKSETPGDRKSFAPQPLRRKLLIGLGSLGALALAGSIWAVIGSKQRQSSISGVAPPPTPQIMTERERLWQYLDPSTKNWINNLASSPAGDKLAAATASNLIVVLDLNTLALTLGYPTQDLWTNDVAWSKSNLIASANANFTTGSVQVWQFPQFKPLLSLKRDYPIRTVSWFPAKDHLAFAGHATIVEVWDIASNRAISSYSYSVKRPNVGVNRVKWSHDARYIAAADDSGTVHVWEAATGKSKTIYSEHQDRVIDLTWCPDKYLLASASADRTARVWDALSGHTILTYRGHTQAVHSIDWSSDKQHLMSGSYDTTVQVWQAVTGNTSFIYTGRNSGVVSVCWIAGGGRVAFGSQREGVEVWQAPQS
jgi:WD40 repeat protein/DNA-binding XRE family transcriptional regulator